MIAVHAWNSLKNNEAAFEEAKPNGGKKAKNGARKFGTVLTNANAGLGKGKGKKQSKPSKAAVAAVPIQTAHSMVAPAPAVRPVSASASTNDISSRFSSLQLGAERPKDVDMADRSKPEYVTDYVVDIFKNFKKREINGCASSNYMSGQSHITAKMRTVLIDWLVDVHLKFKLMPETLFLTVNMIDRFLQAKVVDRHKLQLVGVTCMLLASKYEEIYFPEIRDFVYITNNAYNRRQILKMEEVVLNVLRFNLTVPTTNCFVKRFIKAANLDTCSKLKPMASYLGERMLQEYDMLAFRPSIIAATAVSMSLSFLRQKPWHATLTHYTGYNPSDLAKCKAKMTEILRTSHSHKAVAKKYSSSRYERVSVYVQDCLKAEPS